MMNSWLVSLSNKINSVANDDSNGRLRGLLCISCAWVIWKGTSASRLHTTLTPSNDTCYDMTKHAMHNVMILSFFSTLRPHGVSACHPPHTAIASIMHADHCLHCKLVLSARALHRAR